MLGLIGTASKVLKSVERLHLDPKQKKKIISLHMLHTASLSFAGIESQQPPQSSSIFCNSLFSMTLTFTPHLLAQA